jgi:very-short-patch-repair endonuclease
MTKKKNTEQFFIDAIKIHGNKYDYSQVEYINSKTKINIICKIHGLFTQKENNHLKGYGCPECVNKTEDILNKYLLSIFPDTIFQYIVKWCKNPKTNKYLPFDFFIPSLNIIIQLDGLQHFQQLSNSRNKYKTQERDIYIIEKALENNISVIRLLQDDVFYDKNNWKEKLKNSLYKYEKAKLILLVNDKNIYNYLNILKIIGKKN